MATHFEHTLEGVKDKFIEKLEDLADHLVDEDVKKLNADRSALVGIDAEQTEGQTLSEQLAEAEEVFS